MKQSYEKLMYPWTPVIAGENNGCCTVEVWGRRHVLQQTALPTSIRSGGQEVLAAPIRLVGLENGHDLRWESGGCYLLNHDPEQAVVNGWLQSEASIINTTPTFEYDGLARIDIKVMARGRTVKQVFGLEPDSRVGHDLSRLWLEIELDRAIAGLYHFWPNHPAQEAGTVPASGSGQAGRDPMLNNSGELTADLALPFRPLVWLGDDRAGLTFCAESDEMWQVEDPAKAIEIICAGQSAVLRLHLLDSAIVNWEADNYLPRCFTIWLQATPVKPYEDVLGQRRAVHIDCFTKIESDYASFLFGPSRLDPQETVFERLSRLNVNTLFLHEKWNTIQNNWQTNAETARQTHAIVDEAHARGIKVIPYFGYELASCAPEWGDYAARVLRGTAGGWYRQPPQRDYVVCYNSEWADKLVDGFAEAMNEFGFDGIYLDSTLFPNGCTNEKHGCGYRRADGSLHPTYPVMAIRRMMRRLYALIDPKRGLVNPHQSGCVGSPLLSFTHLYWDGEFLQFPLHRKTMQSIPLDYCRSEFNGRNFGTPSEFLVYESPLAPDWTFSKALSLTLLNGVLPRPNDVYGPLGVMSGIWRALNRFAPENAEFKPFWQTSDRIQTDTDLVKISYLEKTGGDGRLQLLAFICNPNDQPLPNVHLSLAAGAEGKPVRQVINALTGDEYDLAGNDLSLNLDRFGFIIAYIAY